MPEAVIVDAIRSPIGRAFKGSLTGIRPDDLGAYIVDALLDRNPDVDPNTVDDLICGCGLPQGEQSYNIGRAISMLSRLPVHVTGATVARYCASSLNAIAIAADAIKAGNADTYVAAGIEHVSRVGMWSEDGLPQLFGAFKQQAPEPMRDQIPMPEWKNPKLNGDGGRPDLYIAMGETAENVADKYDVSREDMDRYAQRSQELAVQSQESGFFANEIVPVEYDGTTVSKDDGPRASSTYEKLAELKPAFRENGRVTAGNSCPLNDGAAAALLMSDERAKELGLKPKARVLGWATGGLAPEIMGIAPIEAVRNVLTKVGMTIDDIDVVELNEAFAAQVIPIMDECNIPLEKLNTHGGAIALGHPFGMTGARIMATLLNVMETDDKQIGIETMCVAGGQGFAMVVERLN
ncbi:MAG TPA: acetyl-CoA C-acyltransferase [Thermoleophilaceae bacterium]|nr:acetyl-CoA C-acyltransferase [Thermoleophilaceae bacterium]